MTSRARRKDPTVAPSWLGAFLALGLPALASLGLHFWADGRYGIFRDELYYLDCSKHLAAGYVDHPALSIWLLAAWRAVFGESVGAIRVLPALAGAGLVVLTGLLARELGGRLPAQGLAAVAALAAPCYLGITGYYSMNAFDLLFWALAFFLVVRLLKTGRTALWIPFGGVVGLGLENKIGLLTFGAALALPLLATRERRQLLSKELWLGGGLALILFLPYLAWEATHQWATLEFMHNAATRKIAALGVVGFSVGQLLEMHPFNCILALVGLVFLLGGNEGRYRPLGLIWLFAFAIFALQRSKPYYLVGAYPPLLAAGACAVAGVHSRSWRRWLTASVLALLVIGGAVTAPFAIPLLPVDRFIAYQTALGVRQPSAENQEQGVLPQFYADRFGWEELAAGVAAAYTSLPPRMRSATGIVASNYGEAGALNYYGTRLGLPRAATPHNSGYFWGPPRPADPILAVGISREDLEQSFQSVAEVRRFITSALAMPYERDQIVYLCRGLKRPIEEAWRGAKLFI